LGRHHLAGGHAIRQPDRPQSAGHRQGRPQIGPVRQLNDPDPAWRERLPRITAQTLVVGGGSTSHIPQEDLETMSGLIPRCRLVTIEGAGHEVHSARHEQFLALVKEFLAP
jgi:pimeloyl-ACP methyl ester carboxylesterase